MKMHLLGFWMMILCLVVGCTTTQPQVRVTEKPVYVEKDRKSVVQGKSVDLGGRRIIKKKIRKK